MSKEKVVYEEGDYWISEKKANDEDVWWFNRPITKKATKGKSTKIKVGDPVYQVSHWDEKAKKGGTFAAIDLKSAKVKLKELKKSKKKLDVKYKGKKVSLRDTPSAMDNAEEIDREIKDAVHALNKAGYDTSASCAGHEGIKGASGWINFPEEHDEVEIDEILTIMKEHGLRPSKKKIRKDSGNTWIGFSPVGKSLSKAEIKRYKATEDPSKL